MQAGRETLPTDMVELLVEPLHEPDFAGHGGDGRGAVLEEINAADEEQGVIGGRRTRPGDLGRQEGVRRERLLSSESGDSLEPARPLRLSALHEVSQFRRRALAVPGRRQDFPTVLEVREDDIGSVTIEAVVLPVALGGRHDFLFHQGTRHVGAAVEAVPARAQADEVALPSDGERQGHRIEAGATRATLHADAFRDGQTRSAEDAAEHRTMLRLVPAIVLPGHRIVLIAPMTLLAAIEARVDGQEFRGRLLAHGLDGLLGVEIKDPVAVDEMAGGLVVLRAQRCRHGRERRDGRRLGRDLGIPELIERPQAQGDVHALARPLDPSRRLIRPARDADVVDDAVAADGALDQPTEADLSLLRRTLLADRRRLALQDPLAVEPYLHGAVAQADEDVVPLAVADVHAGVEIAATSRRIDAQRPPLGMRIDLPVRARGLLAAGDQDIVAGLAVQLRPDFDRQRPLLEHRPALRDHAARQGLAVLGSERRDAPGGGLDRRRHRLGGGLVRPGTILGLRARRKIVQLRDEVTQSVEIVQESPFGVFLRMVKDADDAGVPAGPDLTEHLEVLRPDADGQDLPTLGVAVDVHAVEVHAEQMRQHQLQRLVQSSEVPMAMMQVVDDADVRDGVLRLQILADGDHVLGLAAPATVVVDRHLAADLGGLGDRRQQAFRGAPDLGLLSLALPGHHHPDLRVELIFLEQAEGLVVLRPEGEVFDAVLTVSQDLGLELRDVLRPPVVGHPREPHLGDHGRALLRRPLLVVERHDAPRRQVLEVVERLGRRQSQQGEQQGAKQSHRGNAKTTLTAEGYQPFLHPRTSRLPGVCFAAVHHASSSPSALPILDTPDSILYFPTCFRTALVMPSRAACEWLWPLGMSL